MSLSELGLRGAAAESRSATIALFYLDSAMISCELAEHETRHQDLRIEDA